MPLSCSPKYPATRWFATSEPAASAGTPTGACQVNTRLSQQAAMEDACIHLPMVPSLEVMIEAIELGGGTVSGLSYVQWVALRAEWELGQHSNCALGDKYGVSEAAIRKRAANPNQPGGAWVRTASAVGQLHDRAVLRTIALMASETEPQPPPHDPTARTAPSAGRGQGQGRTPGATPAREGANPQAGEASHLTAEGVPNRALGGCRPEVEETAAARKAHEAGEVAAEADFRAELREELLEQATETLSQHNRRHLAELDRAMRLLTRTGELLRQALSPQVTPLDRARTKLALDLLLPGKGDSLTGVIAGYLRGLGAIQDQVRKALGVEDRPKKLEPSGLNGGPNKTDAQPSFDIHSLPTEMLETLASVREYLDGERGDAPLPMLPPSRARH